MSTYEASTGRTATLVTIIVAALGVMALGTALTEVPAPMWLTVVPATMVAALFGVSALWSARDVRAGLPVRRVGERDFRIAAVIVVAFAVGGILIAVAPDHGPLIIAAVFVVAAVAWAARRTRSTAVHEPG